MKRLDGYFKDNATEEGDEFWVCIDSDHWVKANHVANLVQVLQQCGQKGYCFAISNPCIELWLLLHFADVEIPVTGRLSMAEAEMQLRSAAGGYKKAKCDRLEITGEQVVRAIERAKTLDVTDEELPRSPFTRVYQIVESLLEKDAIDLSKPGDGH